MFTSVLIVLAQSSQQQRSRQTPLADAHQASSLLTYTKEGRRSVRPFVGAINGQAFILEENARGVKLIPFPTTFPVFKAFGLSADGQKLLYTSLKNRVPSGELYLEELSAKSARKITPHLILEAAWSPANENKVAYTFSGGANIGLAQVEIDSGKVKTLVAENVFAEILEWDDEGKGIHYYEAGQDPVNLKLNAKYAPTAEALDDLILGPRIATLDWRGAPDVDSVFFKADVNSGGFSAHLFSFGKALRESAARSKSPVGFPLIVHSAGVVSDSDSLEDYTLSAPKNYAYRAAAADGLHEVIGENILESGALYARSLTTGKLQNLGQGQVIKILRTGIVVKKLAPHNLRWEFVNWAGRSTPLGQTAITYNLPLRNSTMIQGGSAYTPPGSCQITAHTGTMAYAYDFRSPVIHDHALAAADGLVVYTVSDVTCNTIETSCPDYNPNGCPGTYLGNVVILQHADGTYTKYAHMETNSVQVAVGTSVCQGLYLGRQGHIGSTSGTFNSCGDHVHFQRQTSPDIFGQSISVDFSDVASNPLSCGTSYLSGSTEVANSISPTSNHLGVTGGSAQVNVTSTGCSWTATSNNSWITITGAGPGSGNGVVSYAVADNSAGGTRTGTLTVAGRTFTVNQDGGGVSNQPPTVNAGSPQTITLPANAVLNGTAADDGLPNPPSVMTTTWSKLSGPGSVTFADPNALNTNASFSLAGIYLLRLSASDGALSSTSDVKVIVNTTGGGGSLIASSSNPPANTDLTGEGTADWAHWGLNTATSFNHKNNVPQQISNLTQLGTIGFLNYNNNPGSYSWADGTPTAAASNTTTGLYVYGIGNGFQLSVPADTIPRTLKLYVGVWAAQGRLETWLSDGGASPYIDTSLVNQSAVSTKVYLFNYQAASSGQTLTIRWTVENNWNSAGNITLQAASLSGGFTPTPTPTLISTPTPTPTPGSNGLLTGSSSVAVSALVNLSSEGTADWAHWGLNTATSFNHKNNVPQQISNLTQLGGVAAQRYNNNPSGYTWTGGTPTAAASNTTTGLYVTGTGNGFQLTLPADTSLRTLRLYLGVWAARGRLSVSLSDNSAASYIDNNTLNNTGGTSVGVYTLNYRAGSGGQQLVVRYTVETAYNAQYGNVTFQAATLQ